MSFCSVVLRKYARVAERGIQVQVSEKERKLVDASEKFISSFRDNEGHQMQVVMEGIQGLLDGRTRPSSCNAVYSSSRDNVCSNRSPLRSFSCLREHSA
jgi:hypothetical protein